MAPTRPRNLTFASQAACNVGTPGMKIAILGAGISGLVAAYHLRTEHDVTVFEANDYPGGHTNTVRVELDGNTYFIDTGFIVFNDRTYPHFTRLLDELAVESQPTTMSFSVRDAHTGLEYNGHSLNALFAQRRNLLRPSFHRMIADIFRFIQKAQKLVEQCDDGTTVGMFLKQNRFSQEFARYYLLPMGSAIWSCPIGKFAEFPIRFIVDFYHNHGLLSLSRRPTWRVIKGGSRNYVDALLRRLPNGVRLNSPVKSIERTRHDVGVRLQAGQFHRFDHVIFACHSDQALRLLGENATRTEREVLSEFPYERNVAVLHTDSALMPRTRRAWASWNYHLNGMEECSASVTYCMNMLQRIHSRHTFCVTLNAESQIEPSRILRRFVYHHPVFTTGRAVAQARHSELLNANRTSFCGAYWRNGFHEDGVVSALAVVNAIRSSRSATSASTCATELTGTTS